MRNPLGYAVLTEPGKSDKEFDSTSCGHCNGIVLIDPTMDAAKQTPSLVIEVDRCRMCMRHVCPLCAGKRCHPFEKKLDRMENKNRMTRLAAGSKY